MEVDDDDIGAGLLRQFNCMNTNDRDSLVVQLQQLVGVHLSEQTARFYLDMTDWNLQAAVCAYFDLQAANKLPQMVLIQDITVGGSSTSVPPNTKFTKTWKIGNNGDHTWPEGCRLQFTDGYQLGAPNQVSVRALQPGQEVDVTIEMISPNESGHFTSTWSMITTQGNFFGDKIWMVLSVSPNGTLALIQQMVNMKELGSLPEGDENSLNAAECDTPTPNPFGNYNFNSQSQPCTQTKIDVSSQDFTAEKSEPPLTQGSPSHPVDSISNFSPPFTDADDASMT